MNGPTADACVALLLAMTREERDAVKAIARQLVSLGLTEEIVSGLLAVVILEASATDPSMRGEALASVDSFRALFGTAARGVG